LKRPLKSHSTRIPSPRHETVAAKKTTRYGLNHSRSIPHAREDKKHASQKNQHERRCYFPICKQKRPPPRITPISLFCETKPIAVTALSYHCIPLSKSNHFAN
jgi:hypothetical protein